MAINVIMIIVLVLILVIPVIIYILVHKASKDFKHYHKIKKEKRLMNEVMSSQDEDERKSLINTITLRQTLRKTLDERYRPDSIFDGAGLNFMMKIIPVIITIGVFIGVGILVLSSFNKVVKETSSAINVTKSFNSTVQETSSFTIFTFLPTILVVITVAIFFYWFTHILDWNNAQL